MCLEWMLGLNLNLKVDARLIVSVGYGLFGLIDLVIFSLSGLRMIHMGVLGLLSMVSGIGLLLRRNWFVWLAIILAPLTLTVGVSTLYSSVGLLGFSPNLQVFLLNLGLLLYIALAFVLLFYSIAKRKSFLD